MPYKHTLRHEVCRCWKTGDWSTAPSPYRLLRDEIIMIGRLVMRGMQYFSANLLDARVRSRGSPKDRDSKGWSPKQSVVAQQEQHGGEARQAVLGMPSCDPCFHHASSDGNHLAKQTMERPCV